MPPLRPRKIGSHLRTAVSESSTLKECLRRLDRERSRETESERGFFYRIETSREWRRRYFDASRRVASSRESRSTEWRDTSLRLLIPRTCVVLALVLVKDIRDVNHVRAPAETFLMSSSSESEERSATDAFASPKLGLAERKWGSSSY